MRNNDSKQYKLEAEVSGSFREIKAWTSWSSGEQFVYSCPSDFPAATAVRLTAKYPNGYVQIKYVEVTERNTSAERKHSAHPHILQRNASGGWRCDVCGRDGLDRSDVRWRCTEGCDWDCCGECIAVDEPAKRRYRCVQGGAGVAYRKSTSFGDRDADNTGPEDKEKVMALELPGGWLQVDVPNVGVRYLPMEHDGDVLFRADDDDGSTQSSSSSSDDDDD